MSGYLSELIRTRRADKTANGLGCWGGVIAKGAGTVTDTVEVLIPAFSDDQRWGPCPWQPRVEEHTYDVAESPESSHLIVAAKVIYPQRGDPCLVAFDENDQPWITCWTPA